MGNSTKLSVLICTYNRCQTLGTTLESVAAQVVPSSLGWEILVIDNNSSDETRQVVEEFHRRFDRIRYLFEPEQGLSHARNAGIREARGEILAFFDDDEVADAHWLQSLTANLHGSEWAGAGGKVLPPVGFSPPLWLRGNIGFASGPLASFDKGSEPGELQDPPFGANMAFRKEVFERLGGFRADLGRSGNNMISNEDTEFGRRVLAAKLRIRYEPLAMAYHPVDEARLRKGYFLTWWFNKGRSDFRELGSRTPNRTLLGVPIRLVRSALVEVAKWVVSFNRNQRFARKLQVWACAGQLVEAFQQNSVARTKSQSALQSSR